MYNFQVIYTTCKCKRMMSIVTIFTLGPRVIVELPALGRKKNTTGSPWEFQHVWSLRLFPSQDPLLSCPSSAPGYPMHSCTVFLHLALLLLKTFSWSFCCVHTSYSSYPLCCLPFPKGSAPGWETGLSPTAGTARMCHRVQRHFWNLLKDDDNSAACRNWSISISVFREGVWFHIFLQKPSPFYHHFSQVSCTPQWVLCLQKYKKFKTDSAGRNDRINRIAFSFVFSLVYVQCRID